MKIGTAEHRDLFCGTFLAGHREYEPEQLPWPQLEPHYLQRLRAIPFWPIARAMERKAGVMVTEFAETLDDPVIREAVHLQGAEEGRHARIISFLIDRYGVEAEDLWVEQPAATSTNFILFGYEECLDFFLGAGLFRLATEIDFFPAHFVKVFEDLLAEEARHVTFFINWYRYEQARAGRDNALVRHIVAMRNYFKAVKQLIPAFSGVQTTGFIAAGAKDTISGITPKGFLEAAIAQNHRFLRKLDRRLIKPSLLPTLSNILLAAINALPPIEGAMSDSSTPPTAAGSLEQRIAA